MLQRLIIGSVLVSTTMSISVMFNSPARGAECGGAVKCSCGDEVIASRTLVSGKKNPDPVLKGPCLSGHGLIITRRGVILKVNGKIEGSGLDGTVGILVQADAVTISGGRIDNFDTGIGGVTNASTIDNVKPYFNRGDGIFLTGNGNHFVASPARHSGKNGYTIIGDNNILENQNNEYNGFDGIYVEGDGNRLTANKASENRKQGTGNGITVEGSNNIIELSDITKFNTNGIVVTGDNNTLDQNSVTKQRGDGIIVDGNDNVLTDNISTINKGVGISVVGAIGDPAASTGNRVSANRAAPQCEIYGEINPPTCIAAIVTP